MSQQHAYALRLQAFQRGCQLGMGIRRHRHPQDTGELPGHARHAALQPVAAVIGDALGQSFDQTGLIVGDDGENEVIHGRAPVVKKAPAQATAH